jgi:hypothetical protein
MAARPCPVLRDLLKAMSARPRRHTWLEAARLCCLNQPDIEMAKRLGFAPGALIRAIPNRRQQWKLPVRDWVRDLYSKQFGEVLGEKPRPAAPPPPPEYAEEEARRFGEELYWEDYWDCNRNSDPPKPRKPGSPKPSPGQDNAPEPPLPAEITPAEIIDEDPPF